MDAVIGKLPLAGLGCLITGIGAIFLALHFHTQVGISDSSAIFGLSYFHMAMIAPVLVLLVSLAWYYIARSVRKGEGIDLALAYKAIPPD